VIFNTYTRSDSLSSVQAYSYDRFTHDISNKWRGESLNGVATAPVLSPDYTHVYVQDGDGDLVAMDTATGAVAWKFPLGFVSMEPPVVSASGYILPGGSQVDSPGYDSIGLIEDFGDHADWLFQDNTLAPLSSAAAGAGDRFVLAGRNTVTGELQIVVLDPTGIVATSPWGAALPASVDGLVLDTQGNLFVQTSGGIALKAFSPATVP
jgi:outer membrane protein assembly factor BamB